MTNKKITIIVAAVAIIAFAALYISRGTKGAESETVATVTADTAVVHVPEMKYNLDLTQYAAQRDTVRPGETLAELLYGFGFTSQQIHQLTQCPDSIFDARKMRPGQVCILFSDKESNTPRYLVYEESVKNYVTFDLADNYLATRGSNPTHWRESEVAGNVESSLWVAMEKSNASPQLAVQMSHIFGWSIDFFGIQKGDEFRLIYQQEYVGETPLNSYAIKAASFCTQDSTIYAIPFFQEEETLFYNIDGNSLEGAFLKAPLDYYRISSHFSNSRLHPVLRIRRPHHGVDYAAPAGTPVYAIGSGKVIKKAYQANGAGYYIKIRHNSTYTTSYMHLSRFAEGLKEGDFVQQKQVIGYVGSTGLSTGPHLDFRVFENGTPIDPLSIKSQPKMPISEENRAAFNTLCDSLVTRLGAIPITTVAETAEEAVEEFE